MRETQARRVFACLRRAARRLGAHGAGAGEAPVRCCSAGRGCMAVAACVLPHAHGSVGLCCAVVDARRARAHARLAAVGGRSAAVRDLSACVCAGGCKHPRCCGGTAASLLAAARAPRCCEGRPHSECAPCVRTAAAMAHAQACMFGGIERGTRACDDARVRWTSDRLLLHFPTPVSSSSSLAPRVVLARTTRRVVRVRACLLPRVRACALHA
jgi:hypothetical protein